MKKAFDQNVSRARPRLRLGALITEAADAAQADAEPVQAELAVPPPPAEDLGATVKAKAERARAPKVAAAEAVQRAIADAPKTTRAEEIVFQATAKVLGTDVHTVTALAREEGEAPMAVMQKAATQARAPAVEAPVAEVAVAQAPVAHAEPPQHAVEVQTPTPELPGKEYVGELDPDTRRERLKARLRAVRENPRPEPLPPTVAEAGVLAVERIATLQAELHKVKALNLALTQDLESARRQAEKATEEARLRMEESRRLSSEMEGRVRLLQDLERELAALEGERDDALLALQETRQGLSAASDERKALEEEIAKRDQSLAESLAEEERLCGELESAREDAQALRRSVDALRTERDTLARQVSELTTERAELLEARKALEAVHRALSTAAAR